MKTIVSPPAPCAWPRLGTPDTKFSPDKPKHSLKIILDPGNEAHAAFMARMDALDETLIQALDVAGEDTDLDGLLVKKLYRPNKDKDKKKTGLFEMTFERTVEGSKNGKRWTFPVTVFDGNQQPITDTAIRDQIGGGSIIQVAFTARVYRTPQMAGFQRRFEAVMLRKLVQQTSTVDATVFGDYDDDSWAGDFNTGGDGVFPATTDVGGGEDY